MATKRREEKNTRPINKKGKKKAEGGYDFQTRGKRKSEG
jgi:hypothetical protein